MALGIDIGGVLIERGNDTDDTFFSGRYTKTPAVQGAIDAIRRLSQRFGGHAYLISKCGANTEAKTRGWLEANNFYDLTGIPEANVRYCKQRPDKVKICTELGITHYIDDRMDVLVPMIGIIDHLYLFMPTEIGIGEHGDKLDRVKILNGWSEAEEEIKRSVIVEEGIAELRIFQENSSELFSGHVKTAKEDYAKSIGSYIAKLSSYENPSKDELVWLEAFISAQKDFSEVTNSDQVIASFSRMAQKLKALCIGDDFGRILKEKREDKYPTDLDPVRWIEVISKPMYMVKTEDSGIAIPYDFLTDKAKRRLPPHILSKEDKKKLFGEDSKA